MTEDKDWVIRGPDGVEYELTAKKPSACPHTEWIHIRPKRKQTAKPMALVRCSNPECFYNTKGGYCGRKEISIAGNQCCVNRIVKEAHIDNGKVVE